MSALADSDRSVLSFMAQSIEIQQLNEWDNHAICGEFPENNLSLSDGTGGFTSIPIELVSSPLTSWGKNNKQIGALTKKNVVLVVDSTEDVLEKTSRI